MEGGATHQGLVYNLGTEEWYALEISVYTEGEAAFFFRW